MSLFIPVTGYGEITRPETMIDRLGRKLTDTFDHSYRQITGHHIEPATGTYYTDQGYLWQVHEEYWASMGLGTWDYPLAAFKTYADADAFIATMQPTVGKYIAQERQP